MEQAPSSFSMFFKHFVKTRHLQLISLKKQKKPKNKHYTVLKEKKNNPTESYCNNGEGMTPDARLHDSRKHNIYMF